MTPEINAAVAHLLEALAQFIQILGPAAAGAIGAHYLTKAGAKIATDAAEPPATPTVPVSVPAYSIPQVPTRQQPNQPGNTLAPA